MPVHGDQFGAPYEVFEVVFASIVQPDLSIDMPRFALHITNVITSSAAFATAERDLLRSPMVHVPALTLDFSADGASVTIRDGDTLVAECRSTSSLERGSFRWEGRVAELQTRGAYGVHPHAPWKSLDLGAVRGASSPRFPTARSTSATTSAEAKT